ncbi:MAG: ParA family protein [Alphaproteobacteria bacterium]|nr:ParA family protein [Alphaproteobacteria bacterium]
MQVVVFTSQKGGSGKTTLCGQLAVQAELSGAGPVAIIDTDPQGSLSGWWNARKAQTPAFVRTHVDELAKDLKRLRMLGIQLVFIDTQPSVTQVIAEIVDYADLVVIPTRPSPHDLRAIGPTLDIVQRAEKPLVFAINGATQRTRITGDVAVALSQHGTVAPTAVHNRIDFATSMIKGGSVIEANPDGASAKEIGTLWTYLSTRLERLHHDRDSVTFEGPLNASASKPAVETRVPADAHPRPAHVGAAGFGSGAGVFGRRPSAMAPHTERD